MHPCAAKVVYRPQARYLQSVDYSLCPCSEYLVTHLVTQLLWNTLSYELFTSYIVPVDNVNHMLLHPLPIVLCLLSKKLSNNWRVCGDFRRLNIFIEPERHLTPRVHDINVVTRNTRIFLKL
uniref:Uncharacterized protein n=1 Tax=Glossina pallidipes TaxID=7398 RepID=A0A1A9Z1S2_GLOPL